MPTSKRAPTRPPPTKQGGTKVMRYLKDFLREDPPKKRKA